MHISNGLIRVLWTKPNPDGPGTLQTGEEFALTPFVAKQLSMELARAVEAFQRERSGEVVKLEAG